MQRRPSAQQLTAALLDIISNQTVDPVYRGWSITGLNKSVDRARILLGLAPVAKPLTPEQAKRISALLFGPS